MGFAAAAEADHGWYEEAKRLRARLDEGIAAAGGEIVAGDGAANRHHRLPTGCPACPAPRR